MGQESLRESSKDSSKESLSNQQTEGQSNVAGSGDLPAHTEIAKNQAEKGDSAAIPSSPRNPVSVPSSPRSEIQELKSQIEELRATVEVSRHSDIVDSEVVTMLVKQGYSVDSLRQSKPYLFKSQGQAIQGQAIQSPQSPQYQAPLEQPKRIIAPTKSPTSSDKSDSTRMTNFVNTLASMITGTQIKQ